MSRLRLRSRWFVRGLFVAGCVFPGGCADTRADREILIPPTIRLVEREAGVGLTEEVVILPGKGTARQPVVPVALTTKDSPPALAMVPSPSKPAAVAKLPAPTQGYPPAFVTGPGKTVGLTPASHSDEPLRMPEMLPTLPDAQPVKSAEPVPKEAAPAPKSVSVPAEAVVEEKPVPINLDTVLRLAEEQNPQIALARVKLQESEVEQGLAARSWLPRVLAGAGYYRHEGGIQNENGSLTHSSTHALYPNLDIRADMDLREATYQRVNAERKSWQQRGELSKVTSETLLEASTAYVDLLTARRGEQVAKELEKYLLSVQDRAEKQVTATDRSAQAMVEAVRAEISSRRLALAKVRQQGDASAAKLAYLLGLGPMVRLVPVEESLTPIDLVDPKPPLEEMVARASVNGPGVRETQALLNTLQSGLDEMNGPKRLLPVMTLMVTEGYFGAGPGSRMSYDNRLDMGVQMHWNLTEWVTAREKRRLAESRVEQARLTVEDVHAKLTAGVREAREASLSGRNQITHGATAIKHSAESYRLSDKRVADRVPGATALELLTAIRGLEYTHYNYLTAINSYNKAQLRLLVLLGPRECAPRTLSTELVPQR